jgi:tetratricopeptide (TPR) repeat protein
MISLQKRFLSLFILSVVLIFSCNEEKTLEKVVDSNRKKDSLYQLVNQFPDSIQLQLTLQERIYKDGDTAQALSNLLNLITKFPQNPALQNAVSVIYLQKGDTTKAIESLLYSLSINQEQPEVEFELAFLQAAKKNITALDIAERLIKRYDDGAIQAKGHFTKGIYFANLAMPNEAINEFDSAIIKNFTSVDAYIEKGILLLEIGKVNESIATMTKAIALDKKNADILFWLGKAHKQKKEYEQALVYFSETLKLDPNNLAAEQAIKEIKK